ncbi:hypothetical protein CEXT_773391 [Caerostris extrusa]|uniref:Uncharacterized protein n=1 Tax=Caerostris extrusa TaxID=172846 RepID=A0AAV4S6T9_CAEEX|nr:hypothetical protein CEXT_773391 [Caerostris extrusa]
MILNKSLISFTTRQRTPSIKKKQAKKQQYPSGTKVPNRTNPSLLFPPLPIVIAEDIDRLAKMVEGL